MSNLLFVGAMLVAFSGVPILFLLAALARRRTGRRSDYPWFD